MMQEILIQEGQVANIQLMYKHEWVKRFYQK